MASIDSQTARIEQAPDSYYDDPSLMIDSHRRAHNQAKLLGLYPDSAKHVDRFSKLLPGEIEIKFGGEMIDDPEVLDRIANGLVIMQDHDITPIVVVGAGPQFTRVLEEAGESTSKVHGIRITPPEHIPAMEQAFDGVNKSLKDAINDRGGQAVAVNGKDIFAAELSNYADLGSVDGPGGVTLVKTEKLKSLAAEGIIPVVNTAGRLSVEGVIQEQLINLNADYASAASAIALNAEKFIIANPKGGIYDETKGHTPEARFKELTPSEVEEHIAKGIIHSGMVPKARMMSWVARKGVHDTVLTRSPLRELFTDDGEGTIIHLQD